MHSLVLALLAGASASPLVKLQARDFGLGPVKREYQRSGPYAVPDGFEKVIDRVWGDAKLLADAIGNEDSYNDYDTPKKNWFGSDWNTPGPETYQNWPDRIAKNLRRASALYGNEWTQADTIWFHNGGDSCNVGTRAYTNSITKGDGSQDHNIHLCTSFWDDDILPWMGTAMREFEGSSSYYDKFQLNANNYESSKGKTLFHETMHMKSVIQPHAGKPETYGVDDCWDLALNKKAAATTINADSYAAYAVAIYGRHYNGDSDTMVPQKYLYSVYPWLGRELKRSEEEGIPGNSTTKRHVPEINQVERRQDEEDSVDVSDLVDVFTDHLTESWDKASPLICRGVNETREWVTYDSLNPLLSTYCHDAVSQGGDDTNSGAITRTYNPGDNAVVLGMEFAPGTFKPDYDACMRAMSTIKDGCDGNEPLNPLNAKHGGSFDDSNVRYTITPKTLRYETGQCSIVLNETEFFSGDSTSYKLSVNAYEGNGHWLASSGGDKDAGDGNPLTIYAYYAPLQITPEKRDGDYIQFTIGSTSFTSKDNSASKPASFCAQTQQGWNSDSSGKMREMACYFPC